MGQIHIKPSHEGRFTAKHISVKEGLSKGGNTAKQANFARMARRGFKPLSSHVKGNDEHHAHVDSRGGGGPLHNPLSVPHHHRGGFGHHGHPPGTPGAAPKPRIPHVAHDDRGGFKHHGQEGVPGGHESRQFGGNPISRSLK